MNLRVVEGVVRRLFADADFRSRAIADPSAALSEYRLSQDEHVALTKLCLNMADGSSVHAIVAKPMGFWA